MKHSRGLLIVFAPFAVVSSLSAGQSSHTGASNEREQHPGLMTPAEYRQFLASLKIDLARWDAQLAEIDVGSLGLDFKRGKSIEKRLSQATRAIELSEKLESRLEKRQTLGDSVDLNSSMESLLGTVDDLQSDLIWLGGDSSKAGIWVDELFVTQKEIDEDSEKVLAHVLALAYIADDSCPQLRRFFE